MLQFLTDDLLGGYHLPLKRLDVHSLYRYGQSIRLNRSGWSINYQPCGLSHRLLIPHKAVAIRADKDTAYCLLENGMECLLYEDSERVESLADLSLYLIWITFLLIVKWN